MSVVCFLHSVNPHLLKEDVREIPPLKVITLFLERLPTLRVIYRLILQTSQNLNSIVESCWKSKNEICGEPVVPSLRQSAPSFIHSEYFDAQTSSKQFTGVFVRHFEGIIFKHICFSCSGFFKLLDMTT